VGVARWTLAGCVAAGLAAALLLQMTLLAAVIAGAAQGHLAQVPAAVAVALVAIVAARAGLAQVVELSGRRTATRVMSALRTELVGRRLRPARASPGAATAPSSPPPPSRGRRPGDVFRALLVPAHGESPGGLDLP
jgi:ABC-type transport system involved in cytochrome bd biosynthesis fused ATPase/permease subunit